MSVLLYICTLQCSDYTGCVSKNLTLRIITLKRILRTGLKLINTYNSFQNVSIFNFILVKRQLSLKYE